MSDLEPTPAAEEFARELFSQLEPPAIPVPTDNPVTAEKVQLGRKLFFDRRLSFDGFVLTKMDGDARGGAALSIKHVTGKPG